jgi:hypothetical protein
MVVAFGPILTLTLAPETQDITVGTRVSIVYPGGATWIARVRKVLKPLPDGRRRISVVLLPWESADG